MNINFKIWLLGMLATPTFVVGNMLNYTNPTYDIVETTNAWIVNVDVTVDQAEPNEESRIGILDKEAEKSPLFSMAFIQKLANDGDEHAKEIQSIYHAYKHFLENSDITVIQNACTTILKSNAPYTFPKDSAQYLLALTSNQLISPQFENARKLLNKLIPSLEKTLSTSLLQKIDEEQEVSVSEMNNAKHKAFPDLIKYKDIYYAAFREGESHVGFEDLGAIRILKGNYDPKQKIWIWENMQLLTDPIYDLRDPRFFVNHENELQLIFNGSLINEQHETIRMVPHVATLENDHWQFTKASIAPLADGSNGQWIWRVTWNPLDNYGYAFSYGNDIFSLVRTSDGKTFEKVTEIACNPLTDLSEATIRFKTDGTAIAFIRARKNGIIAVSDPTTGYLTWNFNVIPFRVGGPNFVFSHDEHSMWAATRHFFLNSDNELDEATILASMNQNELVPLLRLKSSYDSSYPGIVLEHDGALTILYYSSTLDATSNLYITRILPIERYTD